MGGHLVRDAAEALGHPPQPIVSLGGTDTRFCGGLAFPPSSMAARRPAWAASTKA